MTAGTPPRELEPKDFEDDPNLILFFDELEELLPLVVVPVLVFPVLVFPPLAFPPLVLPLPPPPFPPPPPPLRRESLSTAAWLVLMKGTYILERGKMIFKKFQNPSF